MCWRADSQQDPGAWAEGPASAQHLRWSWGAEQAVRGVHAPEGQALLRQTCTKRVQGLALMKARVGGQGRRTDLGDSFSTRGSWESRLNPGPSARCWLQSPCGLWQGDLLPGQPPP